MTPSLPDILTGHYVALGMPLPSEAAGPYTAGRIGILALLSILAAQEAERGVAARLWENGALRALFATAAPEYNSAFQGRLAAAAGQTDEDFTWSGLDSANAGLRRLLIALHEAVEERGDAARNLEILRLYKKMAHERRLELPDLGGG